MTDLAFEFGGVSVLGRSKSANRDRWGAFRDVNVLVVADGMGDTSDAGMAAELTVSVVADVVAARRPPGAGSGHIDAATLTAGIVAADKLVRGGRRQPGRRARGAAVAVAAFVAGPAGPRLVVAHAGNARCLLWRAGAVASLTIDHSMAVGLIASGRRQPDSSRARQTRSVLTRYVGCGDPRPAVAIVDLRSGDRIILCTDGLTKELDDTDIARLAGDGSAQDVAAGLAGAARARGGGDDITVVVAVARRLDGLR